MGKRYVSIVLAGLLVFVVAVSSEPEPPGPDGTTAPVVAESVGSEVCMVCHEDVAAAFGETAHAVAPGWDAETGCESCHGPGSAHVEDGEGGAIQNPRDLDPRASSDTCIACHQQQHSQFNLRQGIHNLSDVACVDCHNAHATTRKMLRGNGTSLCSNCHQGVEGQFSMARSHPFSEPDDGCMGCHNPHGSKNGRLQKETGGATCTNCHAENAGPFLYPHDVSIVDSCSACHQVHGSTNRHLLTNSRQINLCYQCHSGATTPGWHSAQNFLNEKCTACHTAIHGSNTNPFFLEE
jgi:DmsE family decaheme c-type cytochrome